MNVYKYIDPEKLNSKSNPLAVYYSIIKIISQANQKKYDVVTTFDQEIRMNFLKEYLSKVNYDVGKNPRRFISVRSQSGIRKEWFFMWVLIFVGVALFAFNNDFFEL